MESDDLGGNDSPRRPFVISLKDHSKSLADLKKVARKLGVKVEAKPEPPMQWELSQVGSQSGKSFDQKYASLEVADHIQDIKDTAEEATSGTHPSVRALAREDLPVLKKHLALSKAALKKVS
jgi:putative membrane protein